MYTCTEQLQSVAYDAVYIDHISARWYIEMARAQPYADSSQNIQVIEKQNNEPQVP